MASCSSTANDNDSNDVAETVGSITAETGSETSMSESTVSESVDSTSSDSTPTQDQRPESVPDAEPDGDAEPEQESTSTTQLPDEPSGAAGITTSIVVESTPVEYFVLYVRPDLDAERELAVAIAVGQEGSTTISDGRAPLPDDHYRVETFSIDDPGDVDGDGIDDMAELAAPDSANPLNPADALDIELGSVLINDRAAFETLSYQGDDVARDAYLAGLEFVKFWLIDVDTDHPTVYFMNTEEFRAHPQFASAIGLPFGRGPAAGTMRGDVVFNPDGVAPDGSVGTFRFAFQPNDAYPFEDIALAFETLTTSMPFLTNNLYYEPYPSAALPLYEVEKAEYDAYRIPILLN